MPHISTNFLKNHFLHPFQARTTYPPLVSVIQHSLSHKLSFHETIAENWTSHSLYKWLPLLFHAGISVWDFGD